MTTVGRLEVTFFRGRSPRGDHHLLRLTLIQISGFGTHVFFNKKTLEWMNTCGHFQEAHRLLVVYDWIDNVARRVQEKQS